MAPELERRAVSSARKASAELENAWKADEEAMGSMDAAEDCFLAAHALGDGGEDVMPEATVVAAQIDRDEIMVAYD